MYDIKFFWFSLTFSLISNGTYLHIDLLWCSNFGDVCLMCLIWTVNIICCLPMFKFPFDGQRITRFLFLIYISTFNVFIPTFIVQKKTRFFFSFFFFQCQFWILSFWLFIYISCLVFCRYDGEPSNLNLSLLTPDRSGSDIKVL